MERITEYKAAGITALLFTMYQTIQTTVGSMTVGDNNLSIAWIFLGEALSFIPLGALLFFLIWLSKKKPHLFFKFSVSAILMHLSIAIFMMSVHSVWDVYLNTIFLGPNFSLSAVLWNFFGLLEMRGMFYLTIVGLIFVIRSLYDRQKIIEKESELQLQIQRMQLRSIELRMNPDIIYPNLSFIRENLIDNPHKSSQMIIQLSALLRTLVEKMDESEIKLRNDAHIFQQYIELIQLRSEWTFHIRTNISDVNPSERVPSVILLMPFLESLFFGNHQDCVEDISSISFKVEHKED